MRPARYVRVSKQVPRERDWKPLKHCQRVGSREPRQEIQHPGRQTRVGSVRERVALLEREAVALAFDD